MVLQAGNRHRWSGCPTRLKRLSSIGYIGSQPVVYDLFSLPPPAADIAIPVGVAHVHDLLDPHSDPSQSGVRTAQAIHLQLGQSGKQYFPYLSLDLVQTATFADRSLLPLLAQQASR